MSTTNTMRAIAAGILLVGMFAGAAGAQLLHGTQQTRFINTGLFSVAPGEGVKFHVTLDDHQSGAPTRVSLRLFDRNGVMVARKDAVLQPGQSDVLQMFQPGLYRAQAQVVDPGPALDSRRSVMGTVGLFNVADAFATETRYLCSFGDNVGGSRLRY